MKKYIAIALSLVLILNCFAFFTSCSNSENSKTVKKLELDINFEAYETGALLYDAEKLEAQDFGVYSSEGKLYQGKDYAFANISVTDSVVYTGEKSMKYDNYGQYVTTPLKLLPNTKYTLSFFYYCQTEDPDCHVSKLTCGVYDTEASASDGNMTKLAGAGTQYTERFNENFASNTWRKVVMNFETYDQVENAVFGCKIGLADGENVKSTCFIDNINLALAKNVIKSDLSIKNSTASSVELITATPDTIFPGDKVKFKVFTADNLTPKVEVNANIINPDENGDYSFVADKKVEIKVKCDGDDKRRDANIDKEGNDLSRYNADIAALPIWEGDTVYHENLLFVPGRDTAKLLYPISEVISVRSYDLYTNYIEGVDFEITDDGLIKRLENSRIPLYKGDLITETENAFPTADGKYLEFIGDHTYVKYGIAVTYEHKTQWQDGEGYNPIEIRSVEEQLPKVFEKLKKGEEVNILIYGDSISTGWSSSGLNFVNSIYSKTGEVGSNVINVPPYTPTWPEMVKSELERLYPKAKINLKILALGGTKSNWGAKSIKERLGYLGEDWKTDLMILSYGGNDATAKMSSDEFFDNMQNIIYEFRDPADSVCNPEAEVLLWSQSLPNTAATTYAPEVYLGYQDELEYIAGENEGVALVKLTDQFVEIIQSKLAIDYLNTNVNHPNDFTTRVVAQGLIAALTPAENQQ